MFKLFEEFAKTGTHAAFISTPQRTIGEFFFRNAGSDQTKLWHLRLPVCKQQNRRLHLNNSQ
jgi:hypothetical protein